MLEKALNSGCFKSIEEVLIRDIEAFEDKR
jgi:hypothetical protein